MFLLALANYLLCNGTHCYCEKRRSEAKRAKARKDGMGLWGKDKDGKWKFYSI